MSKKDRERAAAGNVFRDGNVLKLVKCPVPGCSSHVITGHGAHGLCSKHEEDLAFLLFVLPRIRVQKSNVPGGLVLPSQPGFGAVPNGILKRK